MIYAYEAILAVILLLITIFHAQREEGGRKPVSALFHTVWSLIYFCAAAVMWWKSGSWHIMAMAVLMRFDFYNAMLNGLRHRGIFYLSVDGKHPAITDGILLKLGPWYPPILILLTILFIVIQFFI